MISSEILYEWLKNTTRDEKLDLARKLFQAFSKTRPDLDIEQCSSDFVDFMELNLQIHLRFEESRNKPK
jgi:hypothetical protein